MGVGMGGRTRRSLRARRQKERTRMPEISYAEKADPDSIYADEDRRPLVEATQNEQTTRYAELLWLEQKLIGPLRSHKEDRPPPPPPPPPPPHPPPPLHLPPPLASPTTSTPPPPPA